MHSWNRGSSYNQTSTWTATFKFEADLDLSLISRSHMVRVPATKLHSASSCRKYQRPGLNSCPLPKSTSVSWISPIPRTNCKLEFIVFRIKRFIKMEVPKISMLQPKISNTMISSIVCLPVPVRQVAFQKDILWLANHLANDIIDIILYTWHVFTAYEWHSISKNHCQI